MAGPSHAWVRVEEFNVPVEVHGMHVEPGDLIHADQHGAVVIPIDVADQVPQAAADIAAKEAVLIYCQPTTGLQRRHDLRTLRRRPRPLTRFLTIFAYMPDKYGQIRDWTLGPSPGASLPQRPGDDLGSRDGRRHWSRSARGQGRR